MPAANKLIVLRFVTFGAIGCRQMLGNHEATVFQGRLTLHRFMTVEACDPLLRMLAHFKLVDDRGRFLPMTFGAFSDSSSRGRSRLPSFDAGTAAINDESGHDQRGGDDDSDEHASKRHERASNQGTPESVYDQPYVNGPSFN
jgi:hypothetical protein